jgi:hypothetical protein
MKNKIFDKPTLKLLWLGTGLWLLPLLFVAVDKYGYREGQDVATNNAIVTPTPEYTSGPGFIMNRIEGELVDDFPVVPMYPNLEIDHSYKKVVTDQVTSVGYEALWFTNDDLNTVKQFYIEELTKMGWQIIGQTMEEVAEPWEVHILAKKDKELINVIVELTDQDSGELPTEVAIEYSTTAE